MISQDRSGVYWDPFDTSIDTDPYEVWRTLRNEAPVYYNERYGFYAVSRYADVQACSLDVATYSSAHGTVLEQMTEDHATNHMIIFMDPPGHTQLRSLVSRAFTPRRVAVLEAQIRQYCGELLDAQAGRGGFDYVTDFAALVPSMVISMLLGVPDSDREATRHLIDSIFTIEPGVGMMNDTSIGASLDLIGYIGEQLVERRRQPRDDLFTALTQVEVTEPTGDPRRLTDDEAAAFGLLLVTAGTETVARLLGWAAVVLAGHPDQLATMAADHTTIPGAIEELLRYEAPSPVNGRWTTSDTSLHGTSIPAGSKVLLLTGSAGRDERRWQDADQFDLRREVGSHMSFGFGLHFCLGAALARLEGRVALEETVRRYPAWEVDHGRAERLHTSTVRGWKAVPITV